MFRSEFAFIREITMKRLVLVISIVFSALLINASGHAGVATAPKQDVNSSAAAPPVSSVQRREVEVVTLTTDGFEPHEIIRPPGRFLLSITNRSELDSLNLRIETEQRGKIREKALTPDARSWREVLNLPPGSYIITEADHPEWKLSLIIQ